MRADIGDRIGEDVGPLLFDQRGLLALALRLFVDGARGLLFLDVGDDDAVADDHLQRIDGAVFRQREDIERLHIAVAGILECLREAGAGGGAADVDIHVCGEARRLHVVPVALLEQQAAGLHFVRRDGGCAGARLRNGKEDGEDR